MTINKIKSRKYEKMYTSSMIQSKYSSNCFWKTEDRKVKKKSKKSKMKRRNVFKHPQANRPQANQSLPIDSWSFSTLSKPIYDVDDWPMEYEQIVQTARVDTASQINCPCFHQNEQTDKSTTPSTTCFCLNPPSCVSSCISNGPNSSLDSRLFYQFKRCSTDPTSETPCEKAIHTNTPNTEQDISDTSPLCRNSWRPTVPLDNILQETARKLSLKMDRNNGSKNSTSQKASKPCLNNASFSAFLVPTSQNTYKTTTSHVGTQENIDAEPCREKIIKTVSGEELPVCICKDIQNINKQNTRYSQEEMITDEFKKTCECGIESLQDKLPTIPQETKPSLANMFIGKVLPRFKRWTHNTDGDGHIIQTPSNGSEVNMGEKIGSKRKLESDEESTDEDATVNYIKRTRRKVRDRSRDEPHTGTCPTNPNTFPQCCSTCYSFGKPPWDTGQGPSKYTIKERHLAGIRAYRAKEYSDTVRTRNKVPLCSRSSEGEDSQPRSCEGTTTHDASCRATELTRVFRERHKEALRPPTFEMEDSQDRSCGGTTKHESSCKAYLEFLSILAREIANASSSSNLRKKRSVDSARKLAEKKSGSSTSNLRQEHSNGSSRKLAGKGSVMCCSDDLCCGSFTSTRIDKRISPEKDTMKNIKRSSRRVRISNIESESQPSKYIKRSKVKEHLYPAYQLTRIVPIRSSNAERNGKWKSDDEHEYSHESYNDTETISSADYSENKYNQMKNITNKTSSHNYKNPLIDFHGLPFQLSTKMYYSTKHNYPSTDTSPCSDCLREHVARKYYADRNDFKAEINGSSESLSFNIKDNKFSPMKISVSSDTSILAKDRHGSKDNKLSNFKFERINQINNHLRTITNKRKSLFCDKKDACSSDFSIVRMFPQREINQLPLGKTKDVHTLSQSMEKEVQHNNKHLGIVSKYSSECCSLKEPSYSRLITKDIVDKKVNPGVKEEFLTYYTDDVQTSTADLHKFIQNTSKEVMRQPKLCNTEIALSNTDLLESRESMENLTLGHNHKDVKPRVPMVRNSACTANISSYAMVPSLQSSQSSSDRIKSYHCPPSCSNLWPCSNYGFRPFENYPKSREIASSLPTTNNAATNLVFEMNTSMEIACVQTDPSISDERLACNKHFDVDMVKDQQSSSTQTLNIKSIKDEHPKISRYVTWRKNYRKDDFRKTISGSSKNLSHPRDNSICKKIPIGMRYSPDSKCDIPGTPGQIVKAHNSYFVESNVDLVHGTSESKVIEFNESEQEDEKGTHFHHKEREDKDRTVLTNRTRPFVSGDFETHTDDGTSPIRCQTTIQEKENNENRNETSNGKQDSHHNRLRLKRKNLKFSASYDSCKGKNLVNHFRARTKLPPNVCDQELSTLLPDSTKGKRRVGVGAWISSPNVKARSSRNKMRMSRRHGPSDVSKNVFENQTVSHRVTQNVISTQNNRGSIHRSNRPVAGRTFQKRYSRRVVLPKVIIQRLLE